MRLEGTVYITLESERINGGTDCESLTRDMQDAINEIIEVVCAKHGITNDQIHPAMFSESLSLVPNT